MRPFVIGSGIWTFFIGSTTSANSNSHGQPARRDVAPALRLRKPSIVFDARYTASGYDRSRLGYQKINDRFHRLRSRRVPEDQKLTPPRLSNVPGGVPHAP